MEKIHLFFILAFKEQTYIYDRKIKEINTKIEQGYKIMETTLTWHFVMLSKYFHLHNFYEYETEIEKYNNAVIYHLPYGKDDMDTGVEEKLLKYKGRVPIVMRSYDAHSPVKLSSEYMDKYHDLVLTYLSELVNGNNRFFSQIAYDNFLVTKYENVSVKREFASIILRKENRTGYFEKNQNFKEVSIEKTYALREKYASYKQIDVYGTGWSAKMSNYKGVLQYQKKHETLNRYRFNFVLENAVTDNYISEKILDCFVSLCVPVYIGSPVIENYIPKECFIDIRDFSDDQALMVYLETMDELEYNKYIENIRLNRDTVFDRFSTRQTFALPVYNWYQKHYGRGVKQSSDFLKNEEGKIKKLTVRDETDFELFVKRLKGYIRRKLRIL